MAKSYPQINTLADASRAYFDALTHSVSILTKGNESLLRTSLELTQSTAKKQAKYAEELMTCKTVTEFTEAHSKITQANFDDLVSSATTLSEISSKVVTDSFEPLSKHVTQTVKDIKKEAA